MFKWYFSIFYFLRELVVLCTNFTILLWLYLFYFFNFNMDQRICLSWVFIDSGCTYNGVFHADRSKWNPGNDLCTTCQCAGEPEAVCVAVGCNKPSCRFPVLKDGTCCSFSCQGNLVTDKWLVSIHLCLSSGVFPKSIA